MQIGLRIIRPAAGNGRNAQSGRSSVVEHNLAKVGVVSSNLIARSNFSKDFKEFQSPS